MSDQGRCPAHSDGRHIEEWDGSCMGKECNYRFPQARDAGPSDLHTRCEEILAWRKTGVLPGEALRTLAREKYGDEYDAIQRAERDTETEALNFVIAAPTPQSAPPQEPQKPILYDPNALLEVFQTAQAGSSGAVGILRGITAVIAAWESREPHTLIAAPQPSPAAQGDGAKQLGWVYCYQGQEPAFSYTPQPPGIPKTHYWQVPVFDIGQARAAQEGK